MINGKCNKGTLEINIQGSTIELAADVLCLVRGIYRGINEESEKDAKKFREIVTDEINGCFDKVFDDNESINVESVKSDSPSPSENLNRLLKGLERLKEILDED